MHITINIDVRVINIDLSQTDNLPTDLAKCHRKTRQAINYSVSDSSINQTLLLYETARHIYRNSDA